MGIEVDKIDGGATIWARQTIDSEVFNGKPDAWFKIWFYLVNKVYWNDNKSLRRGQGHFKYRWIQDATGATRSQIDHFFRWAKEEQMLATQKATRGMVVTILKYGHFQDLKNY